MTLALEWTHPQALWALLLAIPLAAFSLYRLKRRRVVVAFLPLLQESGVGARAWSGWRRITEVGSLVARVLALAAVVFALAGPRPDRDARPPETLVLVVDGDMTTRAKESPTESRFQRQVALAKAHVRAHPRGPVAIVLAGVAPAVALPPTEDRTAAEKALDGLASSDAAADLSAALDVAADLARRPARARVLVVSSRALPAVAGNKNSVPIEAVGAGIASDDQGVVDQVVTPSSDGVRTTVRWTIRNYASEPRSRRWVARFEGNDPASAEPPLSEKEVSIPARETVEETLEVVAPRSGAFLTCRLEGDDAFAGNDATTAWLAAPARPSVLVVHGGAVRPFVEAVVAALGDAVDPERTGAVPAADVGKAEPRDVAVVDGVALPSGALVGTPTLYLAPLSGADLPFTVGRPVEKPLVWRAEAQHPLLRGVDLSTAFVARATPIEGSAVRGLAFAESAAVVAEGERSGARWIAFGLDPEGSDLPLRAALPVLVKNAIRILGAAPADPLRPFYRAGEPVRPRIEGSLRDGLEIRYSPSPIEDLRLGPEHSVSRRLALGDPAPGGGPFFGIVADAGRVRRTAFVDLDAARDVVPVRPPSPAPPPAPAEVDVAPAWRRLLVLAALALLVLDLVLVLLARRRPVVAAVVGAVPARG